MVKIILSDLCKMKSTKKIWIKPGKRVGHYRTVEVGSDENASFKANIDKIITLQEFGVEGGVHDDHTFIIQMKDGSNYIYKVMEPINVLGETMTYDLNKIVGWNIVPETRKGDFGKGFGSAQKWIPETEDAWDGYHPGIHVNKQHMGDLSRVFLMDMLLGNYDRHEGNVAMTDKKVYMIDNEAFGASQRVKPSLNSLNDRCNGKNVGYPDPNCMIRWLDKNLSTDEYKSLRANIMNNMFDILKNSSGIKNYIKNKDYKSMGITKGGQREINSTLDNLKDMGQYYKNAMGIEDINAKYNEMCQTLNIMPKYPLSETQLADEVKRLEGVLKKTPGSTLYMKSERVTKLKINLIPRQ